MEGIVLLGFTILAATVAIGISTIRTDQRRALQEAYPIGNGRVLHVGGGDGTLFALTPLSSCEIWDAATGQFTAALPDRGPRAPGLARVP